MPKDPDLWRALWSRLVSELPGRLDATLEIAARTADERKPLSAATVSRALTGKLPSSSTTCLRVLRACGADDLQMLRAAVLLGDDLRGLMAALPRQVAAGSLVRVEPGTGSLGRVVLVDPAAHPARALVLLGSELDRDLDPDGNGTLSVLLHWLPLAGLEVAT